MCACVSTASCIVAAVLGQPYLTTNPAQVADSPSWFNRYEALEVTRRAQSLRALGVNQEDFAVVTAFSHQAKVRVYARVYVCRYMCVNARECVRVCIMYVRVYM